MELSADQCRWRCDPSQFDFGSTEELPAEIVPIGQQRAMNALDFATTSSPWGRPARAGPR